MASKAPKTYDPRMVREVSKRAKKMMNTYSPNIGFKYPDIAAQTMSYPERMGSSVTERALEMIKNMPRVALTNIIYLPSQKKMYTPVIYKFIHIILPKLIAVSIK